MPYQNGFELYMLINVFDTHHSHWPKELLIWQRTVLSLGQMAQLIMIILLLTVFIGSNCSAYTLANLAQA